MLDLKKPLDLLLELPHPLPTCVGGVRQVAALENLLNSPLLLLPHDGLVDRDETDALLLHSRCAGPSEPIITSFQTSGKIFEFSFRRRFRTVGTLQVGVAEPDCNDCSCGGCAPPPRPP